MNIKIDRKGKIPVYMQIFIEIRQMIYSGRFADGFELPSERIMARKLDVHRNTVTRAYAELKDAGLVESKQGVGYTVSFKQDKTEEYRKKAVNWQSLMREEYFTFESDFDYLYSRSFDEKIISFGGGVAAREVYPMDEVSAYFEKVIRNVNKKSYFHMPYQGDLELRKEISSFMRLKGIDAKTSQIQVFRENNQAMNFALSLLLEPGEKVITPDAMSADLYRTIRLAGGEVIPVPTDEEGMICENLEAILEKENPKFIYVDSGFNNPAGWELSIERRKRILDLSYRYRIPIIEEDEGSELYYEGISAPSMMSMDTEGNVLYLYSFSLTMTPGIGLAFIIAPDLIIERLKNMASLHTTSPDWVSQRVLMEYMKDGIYLRRLDDFRNVCREKRNLMCGILDDMKNYGISYMKPRGGVYVWIRLPKGISSRELLRCCQKKGITFMPGYVFYSVKNLGNNYVRLNYSYPSLEEIREGMGIFHEVLGEITGT